jgi:Tfp pilus assembly protein PilO
LYTDYCLNGYIDSFSHQQSRLEQQYKDMQCIEQENKRLTDSIEITQKDLAAMVAAEGSHDFFKKQLLFVLDAAQQSGLKINSYGAQKEKDKSWYKKEVAHFDFSGSLEQLTAFCDLIKKSERMITVSRWSVVSVGDNLFQMHCDIGFIAVVGK